MLVFKKIRRLEEELEALGGNTGDETVRSTIVKTPTTTPRKVRNQNFTTSSHSSPVSL